MVRLASVFAVAATGQAIAGPAPVVERDMPQTVTAVTAEELQKLPASRDLRTILNVHNQLRAEAGARPLRWNAALAANAQRYADVLAETGRREHASRAGRENERENLVVGPRSAISPAGMVQIWVKERRFFRPGTFPNVCVGDWTRCGHYTQMVWPTTTDIGCGFARGRFDALVCRYSPPGNRDGVALGLPDTEQRADRLCTSPRGTIIPCGNTPEEGGLVDDGGGIEDDGAKDEEACVLDVNIHKPINVAPDEPVVAQADEFTKGATTLRNDDADWPLRAERPAGELPVMRLATDVERGPNVLENDLVRIDALNPGGLPNVYLFAFPTDAEPDRQLHRGVKRVNGRHANKDELGYFTAATKAGEAPALPLLVPAGATTFWVEAKLGGRYRFVIGELPAGVMPAKVQYVRDKAETNPKLRCEDQVTLTAAVVDIYQQDKSQRLTAFEVYWGGRPHFRASVWPGGQAYEWGKPYRLGANFHNMPGVAVNDEEVASMEKDAEDAPGDSRAEKKGPEVKSTGTADGNFTAKGRIEGGFQMEAPLRGNSPAVTATDANRYPHRVSLAYKVNDDTLVRPEYLEIIVPTVRMPRAPPRPVPGGTKGVESNVQYTIVDSFDREIKARDISDYLYLYGAGMKAWEALGGQDGRVIEEGRLNDFLFLTNIGLDNNRNTLPRVGPLGTAQRSQAELHLNRMTEARFQDTLRYQPGEAHAFAVWRAVTGRDGQSADESRRLIAQAQDEARQRSEFLRRGQRRNEIAQADQASASRWPLLRIPQDVILQLRVGAVRHDLMVLEENWLTVFAPHFYGVPSYPGNKDDAVFRYHINFEPGTRRSLLVGTDRRRRTP